MGLKTVKKDQKRDRVINQIEAAIDEMQTIQNVSNPTNAQVLVGIKLLAKRLEQIIDGPVRDWASRKF